ncbi:TetR family transcriptional regulator [Frankia sp. AiPs1]|uniref:TetR/AcrR family transcriptional regulator n=1 Tax=Frankia sp. AiPa1 TaxID=573492 RepID=UPI00202B23C6|nr:TetR/AcrR family transcriptional regulator [Frankia sp. AiPa1]MCL9760468.1 TetR family transcriptional regulator [Frankia sp. AiPa1]
MPKRVDHEQRRRHIADALLRVAASRGLHTAGFREVAAEAGVSVRLVQYYFETKEGLLLFGLRRVGELFAERVAPRLVAERAVAQESPPAGGRPASTGRARIEVVLAATLPLDDESRMLYVLYNQYFALALTDPALAAQPYANDPDVLETWLVERLLICQREGLLAPTRDPRDEASALLALTVGLGTAVLAGRHTPDDARRLLARHLDDRLAGH